MVNLGWSDRDGQVGGTYPSTNNPVQFKRHGSDVINWSHVASVASESVTFGATTSIISSGTAAKVGDLLQFTSGVNSGMYTSVREVIGTLYYFSQKFTTEPGIGDTFDILRYVPLRASSSGIPSVSLTAATVGNVISSGAIAAATINAAGVGGVTLIDYTSSPILSVNIFSGLTSQVEMTFDGGSTWITLYAGASPTIEFGDKGRKLESDIKVRKKGATAVTGGDIVGWGTV